MKSLVKDILHFLEGFCIFVFGTKNVRKVTFFFTFETIDFSKPSPLPFELSRLTQRRHSESKRRLYPALFKITKIENPSDEHLSKEIKSGTYPNANIIDFLYLTQDSPRWKELLESSGGKDICSFGEVFEKQSGWVDTYYVRCLSKEGDSWRITFRDVSTAAEYATVVEFAK